MSVKTDSILDKDLYELFGVLQDASVKEIKTAYRKKALECHPDKNPDNPKAGEEFHELSRALAVLIDASARAAYDKIFNAKLAAKKRNQVLDSKRKKFKEDLEEREKQFYESTKEYKKDAENFQAELERLRKLSSKQVEEELNYVKELIKDRKLANDIKPFYGVFRLKLKWLALDNESNGGYTKDVLTKVFSKYGSVNAVVVSTKKRGSALIEFSDQNAAMNACRLEKGLPDNPLLITLIESHPECAKTDYENFNIHINKDTLRQQDNKSPSMKQSEDDFEAMVLQRLKEAEKRKNQETS